MALPYYPDSVKILALFCFGCHHSPDCAAAPQIYLCVGVVGPIMAMMALVIPTILIWPYIQQFCHWSKTFWSILSTFTKQSNVWSWYPYFGLHGVSKKLRFSVQLCPGGWGLIHHLFDPLTLRCGGGGHNGHPWGIYALVPSRLICGTSDFGTIPSLWWKRLPWIFGA